MRALQKRSALSFDHMVVCVVGGARCFAGSIISDRCTFRHGGSMSKLAIIGALVVTLCGCGKSDPSPEPSLAASQQAQTPDVDADARDLAASIRAFYPAACRVYRDRSSVSNCLDGEGTAPNARTFAAAAKCLHDAATDLDAVAKSLPTPRATTPCAKAVEAEIIRGTSVTAASVAKFTAWVDAHKAKIVPNMTRGNALEDAIGEDAPSELTELESAVLRVNGLECMRPLVVCDPGYETDGCVLPKLAGRLGVVCEGSSAPPPGRPVISRRSGKRLL